MQKEAHIGDRGRANMKTMPLARLRTHIYISTALAIAGLTFCLTSQANTTDVNLVLNGSFSATSATRSIQVGKVEPATTTSLPGGVPFAQYIDDWTATSVDGVGSGIAFLFMPSSTNTSRTQADNPGALSQISNVNGSGGPLIGHQNMFALWGPDNGLIGGNKPSPVFSNNGFSLSPNGGNFVALDGGGPVNTAGLHIQAGISQDIHNLVPGHEYFVSFDFASAQEWGRRGDVRNQFRVSLCGPGDALGPSTPFQSGTHGCSQYSPVLDSGDTGFKGWDSETLTFKADRTRETLSFLAIGTPSTEPPIALLDGVDVSPVPEPATWSLMGIGLALIAGFAYRRRNSVSVE